ncbi:carbohydrate ABC transporter permease [Mesorhizobium sp. 113-3-3]|uniref:carbohydrate ABC transporter permease n=1 Tax=Mesorhizobium sp. 113-3-3 TaxID=2744516 RepID=UPI001FCFA159|nr:sugar ABC transporter permease [Mesorhizobium sp. 113-3-3]
MFQQETICGALQVRNLKQRLAARRMELLSLKSESFTARPSLVSGSARAFLGRYASQIALAPSIAIASIFVYGFMIWTAYISFSASGMLPDYHWVGLRQYYNLWSNPVWIQSAKNIVVFTFLYILITTVVGLFLAILLDQRIRAEGALRLIYLYPMALSFVVTGTAWKWILNPGLGIERVMHMWGWESFRFDWLVNPRFALYTVVLAGVWQASGFVMALFLAGLRGIDEDLIKAARLDGAGGLSIYRRIIIPLLGPTFVTVAVVLVQQALRTFDLVIALTNGGPANNTQLPATFMYKQTFERSQLGVGAASAVMIFMTILAIVIPYLYASTRKGSNEHA